MKEFPNFKFEKKLWERGLEMVAGADEVGRGCFAGPVTAGCVIFRKNIEIPEDIVINDSKKLTHNQRVKSAQWIMDSAVAWGTGSSSVKEINELGVGKAANRAFRRSILYVERKIEDSIEFLLVDAFYIPYLRGLPIGKKQENLKDLLDSNSRQLAIKKGDSKSLSIAAASIIAKVHRDRIMMELGNKKKHKKFGWNSNKGYASKQHRNAIIEHGVTSHHRTQFINTFLQNHTED